MWTITEVGLSHVFRLISNLIMTRLLVPEAFGLMAMVSTVQIGLVLLTDLAIRNSIVQSQRGDTARFLRVAWVVQTLRGAIIAGIVVLASGLIWLLAPVLAAPGTVYADPVLPGLIALSSLLLLMKGFESTNSFLAMRRMQMSRVALLNLSSQAVGLVAMVVFAQIDATVWALLLGSLVGAAFLLVLSHFVFDGPKMGFEWDWDIANELWQFGKWLILSSTLTFFSKHADRLILGGLIDKESFGFYVIATIWVQAVVTMITRLAGVVGFSIFSETKRERPGQIARVFRAVSLTLDALCLSGFLIALFGGGLLISILYSPTYAVVGTFIPLLALGILNGRFAVLEMLILSRGDSRAMTGGAAMRAITVCATIPIGYKFMGLEGALLATALSPVAGAPLFIAKAFPILGRQIRYDVFWLVFIAVAAMSVYWAFTPLAQ